MGGDEIFFGGCDGRRCRADPFWLSPVSEGCGQLRHRVRGLIAAVEGEIAGYIHRLAIRAWTVADMLRAEMAKVLSQDWHAAR